MGLVFSRRHTGEALALAYPVGARRQLRPQLISRQSGSLSSCKRGFKTQATFGRRKRNPRPQFGRGTGRDADAKAAVAELLKLKPGYTVQQWADWYKKLSKNPTFLRELQPIIQGLRKGGVAGRVNARDREEAAGVPRCDDSQNVTAYPP